MLSRDLKITFIQNRHQHFLHKLFRLSNKNASLLSLHLARFSLLCSCRAISWAAHKLDGIEVNRRAADTIVYTSPTTIYLRTFLRSRKH
jgi:hypothetical protein